MNFWAFCGVGNYKREATSTAADAFSPMPAGMQHQDIMWKEQWLCHRKKKSEARAMEESVLLVTH